MLRFYLPGDDRVVVNAYGMNGKLVQEVFSGTLHQGRQEITWNPGESTGNIAPGVYLVKVEGNRYSATTKIVVY